MLMSDGGSMKGSGIDSTTRTENLECENIDCIFEGEVDGEIDDFGMLHLACPKCGRQHEVAVEDYDASDPDYRVGD